MDAKTFFEKYDSLLKTQGVPAAEKYALAALQEANDQANQSLFVSIANELGGLYRVTGRFAEGKVVYDAALTSLQEIGMQETVQYATTLINLASVCCEGKQYDEAIAYYSQAEAIYKQSTEVPNYQKAALYNNISSALGAKGKYDEALNYAKQALTLIEQEPKAFTERATTHTALGSLYLRMKDYAQAEMQLLQAQEIFTARKTAKTNIHYSQTLNALGELYFAQGKYDKARQMYEQALSMVKEAYGPNSPVANSLAAKLQKLEELSTTKVSDLELLDKAFEKGSGLDSNPSYGLNLSEKYYEAVGRPMLEQKFSDYLSYMAIGLVGEGSECLGFDDEFSRDHDFGPGFCIWLPEEIYQKIGRELQTAYNELPPEFMGQTRQTTSEGAHRVGVFSIEGFYRQYIGKVPVSNLDWLTLPSSSLLTAVNGKVFADFYGEFSRIREQLLKFYPEDIRLKKLAASIFRLSQAGQYNYVRCIKRRDFASAYLVFNEFVQGLLASVYLLNSQYMPYYKWTFRGLDRLNRLSEVKGLLKSLLASPDNEATASQKIEQIEQICQLIRQELSHQGLSDLADDFLVNHCAVLMSKITDSQIRQLPVMVDLGK